ncbi:MAG: amidohydrolase family protein [Chloroflexi bacterium]|nr:amidohydrolase family protein [Chloroflexota bacterium]
MAYDLLIKNGVVIDGSGLPRSHGNVAIKAGRVVAMGKVAGPAETVIDADGLIVAPGIVDAHTHYDAQITWDPLATYSCWHGVTSVVQGNCGYSIAPCKPEDRDYLTKTLAKVEGISLAALENGVPWTWTTFPEYLSKLDGRLGVNVATYVGHTAIRRYVMGEAAIEREATDGEISQMRQIVAEAMDAGAAGFATSLSPTHVGWNLEPIPPRFATDEEVYALASPVGDANVGTIAILPRTLIGGVKQHDREMLVRLAQMTKRPVITQGQLVPEGEAAGVAVYTLINGRPFDRTFDLKKTSILDGMPHWRDLIPMPMEQKMALMRDESMRAKLRDDIDHPNMDPAKGQILPPPPWQTTYVKTVKLDKNQPLLGKSIKQVAEERGTHVADVLLDLALEEDLETRFRLYSGWTPERETEILATLRSPYTIVGISDGGAHLDRDDGSEYSTFFLHHWVKERQAMSLEEAIRLLTMVPASVCGLWDRGLLRPGYAADVMIFDPDELRIVSKEIVADLPGGGERFGAIPQGIKYTVVNGEVLIKDGQHTGALPGQVLRLAGDRQAGAAAS